MDTILTRYNALGDSIKASRNLWRTVRLGNGELISVEELQRKLATDTEKLTMIAGTVQIPQVKLQQSIQAETEDFVTVRSRYEENLLEVEIEKKQCESDIPLELHQKLVELEKDYNEVGRESTKALLPAPKGSSSKIAEPFARELNA
jgi:hypothetical protein